MTWTGRQQRGVSRWILQLCDDLFLYFFLPPCFFFHFFLHTSIESVSEGQKDQDGWQDNDEMPKKEMREGE